MFELQKMFKQIWSDKLLIIACTIVVTILSVFVTSRIPDVYRSEAVIAPSDSFSSEIPQVGGLGSLASIAGLRLGQTDSQVDLALEYLRSRVFLKDFFKKYPLAQAELMAIDYWDKQSNTLYYDENIYDIENDNWLREPQPMRPARPTIEEAHEKFLKHLSVDRTRINPFIRVSFTHQSPYVAQRWVVALIKEVNYYLQQKSLKETEQTIAYLKNQLLSSQVEFINQSLFALIQTQMEKQMLAQTTPEYIFQIIDPPYASGKKDSPNRVLIIILCMMLGGIFSTVYSILRHHFK